MRVTEFFFLSACQKNIKKLLNLKAWAHQELFPAAPLKVFFFLWGVGKWSDAVFSPLAILLLSVYFGGRKLSTDDRRLNGHT